MNSFNNKNSIPVQDTAEKNLKENNPNEVEENGVRHLCNQRLNEFDERKDEERLVCVHEREDSRAAKMPELKDEQIELNDEIVNLDLDEPPPEVMEYARREVGETDEVKCQTLQELRDMIYEQGECIPHRMDDEFLIRFLRARNFNVNSAHRLIVNYYNFKEEHPEIHQDICPTEMCHIGDDDVITVPAYRTQCGRRMLIYRMGNWDPRKYPVEEIFKATVIVLELGILEPRAQILGGIVVFDLKGITMSHVWAVTPQIANMIMALMVTSFPMKTYSIHILHQSWIFDAIYAVFKPLLNSRMKDRIFFHGDDMQSFHKHISPNYLPKMYGGTREELAYYKWIESLIKVPKIIKEMEQLGYVVPNDFQIPKS
ncbi:alpha-tocopherol transfer protein-like isoform X1 [Polistes fuscatus]|uniref:alpha-tocopherol transfer protein-like isoform X1 n=2 Tax=Polistes fuscatus TaxID=30207 RepID=UPI001CA9AC1A|nr:alpha-tocopherol transfer protein-like isoform X1 [Polistes fuscatus]